MKKHVLLGLSLMLFCFITGGIYIVYSFQNGTIKLERVIALHQVEFLRKTLEHNIEVVQSGLLLQGSPHTDNEITVQHIEKMEASATVCQTCHHEPKTQKKLDNMQQNLAQYMKLYSRALTIRANSKRLANARNLAFNKGSALLDEVKSLSIASAEKISARIDTIHGEIRSTNHFLIACLVLGPIAILIITFFFLKRFTGSINTLVAAAQTLSSGDLDSRIETPLKDEFKTLAESFNNMVDSLKAERKKFESVNALYQTLFESAGDAIMITGLDKDTRGRIIAANSAAAQLYGYSSEELLGMNIIDLVPKEKTQRFNEKMKIVLNGKWSHSRVKRRRKDGTLIPIDLSIGLLELDDRKYLLSFCKDISEQLKSEEEMQRANQMALVGQMAAGLAHEIKNPLAGIKVSLDVICDDIDLPTEDKEIFVRIINEVNRMERLLKSLLNYARPPVPHFDLVDLNRLLDYAIKNVAVTSGGTENQIQFEKDFAEELPQIEADSTQLQQVLLNIYLNAIDAMENGGIITTTTCLAEKDHVKIIISDTGKGLPENLIDKIFTPFYTTKTKGSGLGLAICKRLIEQHSGTIEADSRPDKGTSFVIILPLVQKNRE